MEDGEEVDAPSIADLVKAKKTQCDKDGPMIRRLVESHFFEFRDEALPERIQFWMEELRTPSLLLELTEKFEIKKTSDVALAAALGTSEIEIEELLLREELRERELDRDYWRPLREESERLRHPRQFIVKLLRYPSEKN